MSAAAARFRHRIQARVSVLVAAGMLVPLVAVAWISSGSRSEMERRVIAGRGRVAELVAERLQTLLSIEMETLLAVAESAHPTSALRGAWVRRHALFDALAVVGAEGRVLAQEPVADAAVDGPRILEEAKRAGRPAFTDLLTSSHVYAVVPVHGGAVAGVLDPKSARFAGVLKGYRPVSGESIDLIDSAGAVIASTDPSRVFLRSGAQEDELVALAPLPVARWRVAVRQPRRDALAFSDILSGNTLLGSTLALVVALVFAWGAARSVTRPLSTLAAAADRIAGGELAQPVPVLDEDEVGLLGKALEHMRTALKDSLEQLESRVAERTDAVRQLLGKVIHAQEDERRRVARELHDETTQSLTALVMRVESAATAAPPGELRAQLEATCALAVRTLDGVHRMIADLRPSVLDDLGLRSAILWYAEKHLEPQGIAVRCEFSGLEDRLPARIETVVFRVVQEALTNVGKHAHASSVLVQAARTNGRLALEVEDDGTGFDLLAHVAAAPDGSGWGLLGMRERVEMLGGELQLDSAPGQGTHIKLTVPLGAAHG